LLLPSPPVDQGEGWLAWLRWMGGEPGWPASGRDSPPPVSWTVPRPSGNVWTVTLTADAKSERLEALASLMESLALLAAMVGGLLWALRARLGRALAPLNQLVAAIGGIERSDTAQVQALPPMPVAELDAVAGALRHLGCALDLAESERRQLAQQVLSLQEDERARLARELHDELGQRLTALRVDAAWLAKRLATADGQQETQAVARSMADACGALQQDIRAVLAQLQPFADGAVQGATTPVPLSRLQELLCSLAEGWSARGREQSVVAVLVWRPDDQGQDDGWVEWPPGLLIDARLALAMYRISQEALTNVARHADARSVRLCVRLRGEAVPGGALHVEWAVEDDGAGIPDLAQACRRGSGLANLRERVWALGGELTAEAVRPGAPRPGCRLASSLNTRWASDAMPPP
jgi:two-component system sensor histidine kinase UhpB